MKPVVFALELVAALAGSAGAADLPPRYVFLNLAPGPQWQQDRPETFTPAMLEQVVRTAGVPDNPRLRVGVSGIFSILETPPDVLARSLANLLKASEEAGVPVLVTLDGQNWWGRRPDLWNWWDPAKPGYNPDNARNVEWTGWDPSTAVKIGWRNWGRQIRVCPAPNIASPRVLDAHRQALRVLAPVLARWNSSLPAEKRWLFGGVKVGWEAGIGYNAFYYPDGNALYERSPDDASQDPQTGLDLKKGLSSGVAQLGYAAVKTAGIKSQGQITRDDLGKVTQRYLEVLAREVNRAGVPRDRIFTHQGGTYAPWDVHIPFWPALNRWSRPGWSFYGVDPATAGDLGKELQRAGNSPWAASEWWWGAATPEGWEDHFRRTLGFGNCRFVCVYNWTNSFEKNQAGLDGLRRLVAGWKE